MTLNVQLRTGFFALAGAGLMSALTASAAAPSASSVDHQFFRKKIEPLLAGHCHGCHSHASPRIQGNLVLDSRAGLLEGGNRGPALVPGDPERSLLLQVFRSTGAAGQKHPREEGIPKLSEAQVADLTLWIQGGAIWPDADRSAPSSRDGKFTEEERNWWAFQPLREPASPRVDDNGWARGPVDRFIFERLAKEGLAPAPAADRRVLVRRLYFDLWGLPPSPDEADAFVADPAPDAYERLVERLLASPRYGERWARHWLDLVRYAESDGYRIDDYRPQAWRYRDYVIRAFNEDKPYDRFVREQLAGDEMDPADPEMLVANSYLRHWIYEYNNRDVAGQWTTILNDLTDVTGDVFLGLGLQCARCHNHKFDPILQKDYYRMQAFFAPFFPRQDLVLATAEERAAYAAQRAKWEALTADLRQQIEEIEVVARAKAREESIAKFPEETQALIAKPAAERTPYEHQIAETALRQVQYEYDRLDTRIKGPLKEKLLKLRKELGRYDADKPVPLPPAFTVTDVGPVAPPVFLPKDRTHQPVAPGFPSILEEGLADVHPGTGAPNSTGRRTALAAWLTQPKNPLSTRVIVNRVWQYHFGRGLVATASDFGRLGEKPSHPELLDWLAIRFVKEGWSFKKLHRWILNSATFRQSATAPASDRARRMDPENRLLWRGNVRRLDAEQIRDALLAATGELDLEMGGPAVEGSKPRRTIYLKLFRNTRDPLLDVFDAPEGFSSTAKRNVTTTPTQALLMFNSPLLLQRAKTMAMRLRELSAPGDAALIEAAYRRAFARDPSSSEREAAVRFLGAQARRLPPPRPLAVPFVAEKMPYRDGKAAALSPRGSMDHFEISRSSRMPSGDFTIEAFVLLRSLYDDASVRTIAAHWDGEPGHPGWALGVSGRKSTTKPQTLMLQLAGQKGEGTGGEETIFSGLTLDLNKPYFVAVSVRPAETNENGIAFYAKDLSNDDEPMQVARMAHALTAPLNSDIPFTLGGRHGQAGHLWDGLLDDARLSGAALRQDQLLLANEGINEWTVGYWQFESTANYQKDSSGRGHDIQLKMAPPEAAPDARLAALADLCHVLLNANEFLYVD